MSMDLDLGELPVVNPEQPMKNENAVFDAFFQKLDTEKEDRFKKHLVLVEDRAELMSVTSFSQYVVNGNRLVTVIGELHDVSWGCQNQQVSVGSYVLARAANNSRSKVLLEVNPGVDPTSLGSHGIREVAAGLRAIGREGSMQPIDTRTYFLGGAGQTELYQTTFSSAMSPQEIGLKFIEPFFAKAREDPALFSLHGKYPSRVARYLVETYVPSLEERFRKTASMLGHLSNEQIQLDLKHLWKDVMDFFVISEILRESEIDEYLLLVGDEHAKHIQPILQRFATKLGLTQTGKRGDCVKLFRTFRI